MQTRRRRPLTPAAGAFALFVSTLWGGNAIAIKAGLEYAPPLRLGWMRFVVGGLVVLAWGLYSGADLRPRRHELRALTGIALLFCVQIIFMNLGIKYTTAGHATVLTITASIWIAVLSHFFIPGDRLAPVRLLGVLIAYGGIIVVYLDGLQAEASSDLMLGDALSAISGFLLGVRQVYAARIVMRIEPSKVLLAQAMAGIVVFMIAGLVFEPDPWVWAWGLAGSLVYQGVVIAGFGFIASLWLYQRYLPSRVSVLFLTQPIAGILLAWAVLGEPPTALLWAGGLLVMIGAGIAQWRGRQAGEPARRREQPDTSLPEDTDNDRKRLSASTSDSG